MTTKFETTARTFKAFMEPLLKAACKDDGLPVLCGVNLRGSDAKPLHEKESDPGRLVGVSTDRFRMVYHQTRVKHYEGPAFDFLVSARDAKRLLAVFNPGRGKDDPVLRVSIDGDSMTVDDFAVSVTVTRLPGEFPKTDSLIAGAIKADPADGLTVFGVNGRFLADLAAMSPRYGGATAVRVPSAEGKPILFQPSENLLYLLMPRRVIGADESAPPGIDAAPWVDVIGGLA